MIDRAQFSPDGINHPFPIPIGPDATIPTENIAYLLADLLETSGDVLLLGTGSGYETAILAERCRSVISVESQPIAVRQPMPANVVLFQADAYDFMTSNEFDGILVSFGTNRLSPNWIEQLRQGGRLVVPILIGSSCRITVYERHGDSLLLVDAIAWAPFTKAVEA